MRTGIIDGSIAVRSIHDNKSGDDIRPLEFDEAFTLIGDLEEEVSTKFRAEIVDEEWFDQEINSASTWRLIEPLKAASLRKTDTAALHDALMLRYVDMQSNLSDQRCLIVTNDTTLPALSKFGEGDPVAVTLTTLVQWIAPAAMYVGEDSQKQFADHFSRVIRSRVLPQNSVIAIADFRVFTELHLSSELLPAEDVISAIRHLRSIVPRLNPRRPDDLIKLSSELAKFFADPGRKFRQELAELTLERGDLDDARRELILEQDAATLVSAAQDKMALTALEQRDTEIQELRDRIGVYAASERHRALRRSGWLRLAISFVITTITTGLSMAALILLGDAGSNYQKVISGSQIVAVMITGTMGLCVWVIIGTERLKAMSGPNRMRS